MKESDYGRVIKRWRKDILLFVDEAILEPYNKEKRTHFSITTQQKEGLKAFEKLVADKRAGKAKEKLGISIMSGKGTGKDAMTVWVMLWFMVCFPFPKVPCVSVSADQLNKVLWAEIAKWLNPSLINDWFVLQNDKLFLKKVPSEIVGKRWFAFTKAANPKSSSEEQVETLAGIHEDYLLEIIDEGSGILAPVYNVLEGNLTGYCNLMLLIFNPTRSKGYAVDTQYRSSEYWVTLRWNAEESENVKKATIERLEKSYGRDSNPYRIKVLGLPPLTDEQTLIPWDWIEEAIEREQIPLKNDKIIKGVDCGGGGDKSIIATRKGMKVYPFKRNNSGDSAVLRNWIANDIEADQPDHVRIDTIGLGWHIEGDLRDRKGSIIEAAPSTRSADDSERFLNKRAEMYWGLRDAFEKGLIDLPDTPDIREDGGLADQLGAIKYEPDRKGRTKIIDKKIIKKEIGRSPDEADALALTFFYKDSLTSKVVRINKYLNPCLGNSNTAWMRA